MSVISAGRLAATLPFLLLGCRGDYRAERSALEEKVKAQEQQIAEQRREIASLRRQLAHRSAKPAAKPLSPASPTAEAEESPLEMRWRLALTDVNHRSHSFRARFDVTNLAATRQSGSLCVQLFDQSGSQIDHFFSSERAVQGGATDTVEVDAPLSDKQWDEVARIQSYMAPLGCADDVPANPLSVDKKGRLLPHSDR